MDLNKGLVGHWTMDDRDTKGSTIRDRSAYDNHLDQIQGITTGHESPIGESYEFDRASNSEAMGDCSWNTDQVSVSMWVSTYVDVHENDYAVFSTNNGVGSGSLLIQYTSSGVRWWPSTGQSNSSSFYPGLNVNEWHHIVVTHQYGTNFTDIYIDGEHLREVESVESYPIPRRDNVYLGKWGTNSRYFDGRLSDVRMYDRVLSHEEVNALYNMRSQRQHSMSDRAKLFGEWRCDPSIYTPTSFPDSSGYDHQHDITGTISPGEDSPWGPSIHIDGSNYVHFGRENQFDRDIGDKFTIMCALKPDVMDSTLNYGVFQRGMFNGSYGIDLTSGGNIAWFIRGSSGTSVISGPSISTGEWCHAIGSLDGDTMHYFQNGVKIGETEHTGGSFALEEYGSRRLRFGWGRARGGGVDARGDFDGDIAYGAFYDKAITSEKDAQRLYNKRTVSGVMP